MHIAHLMSDYLSLKMILYSIYIGNKCEADTGWHMKSLLWGVCGLIYQNLHYKLCVCVAQATWSILSNDSSYIYGNLWICDWNCVCFKIRFWYLLNEGIFLWLFDLKEGWNGKNFQSILHPLRLLSSFLL